MIFNSSSEYDYLNVMEAIKVQNSSLDYQKKYLDQVKEFFIGVSLYNSYPYKRQESDAKIAYEIGSSKLLNFSKENKSENIVLLIPSLINKSYILDLNPSRSIAKFLSSNNFETYLIDWNNPNSEEVNFGFEEYIVERISKYIDILYKKYKKPISVIGYCLGGNLALATSILNISKIRNLSLIATPWNFKPISDSLKHYESFLKYTESSKYSFIPGPIIQQAFSLIDPDRIFNKFIKFSKMNQNSKKAKSFVEIEKWVNDGISITTKILFDCIDLLNSNKTYLGKWKISGKLIKPEDFPKACFLALPLNDKIVPINSSRALIDKLKYKHVEEIDTGHIALIVGKKAPKSLWLPLKQWLTNN